MSRIRFKQRRPGQRAVSRGGVPRPVEVVKAEADTPLDAVTCEGMASLEDVRELIGSLIGENPPMKKAIMPTLSDRGPFAYAAYRDDQGALGAAIVCELEVAASMSAALTLVSPEVCREVVQSGKMDDATSENFQEVMNICTQMVRVPGASRVTLGETQQTAEGLTQDMKDLMRDAEYRIAFHVEIPNYDSGRLALFIKKTGTMN